MASLYKRASKLSKAAVAADAERDWTNAITLYIMACEYLIGAVKHDRIPTRREAIKTRIAAYLTRTEQLKAVLCGSSTKRTTPAAAANAPRTAAQAQAQLSKYFSRVGGDDTDAVTWNDVGGLAGAKDVLDEALIFPQKHPELFKGKRQPWRGILLFGPPGTGKSLVVKAAAAESGLPVAFISAADIMSKWQGESEKALKQLFADARRTKPCVVFIDEIDSIGRERQEGENESARRLKTELLRQLDGVGTDNQGVTFIAATNTPWELDPALRRRFDQMVYLPLPDAPTRERVLKIHLAGEESCITDDEFKAAAAQAKGYSAADLQIVAREALMLPIRNALKSNYFKKRKVKPAGEVWEREMWVPAKRHERGAKKRNMLELDPDSVEVGKVTGAHLKAALKSTPASVSTDEVRRYEAFTSKFRARNGAVGSGSVSSMRTASRASTVAAGAGAGVGAGAGAAQRAAAMPDAPSGGMFAAIANAFSGLFGLNGAPQAGQTTAAPPNPPPRRLVPG